MKPRQRSHRSPLRPLLLDAVMAMVGPALIAAAPESGLVAHYDFNEGSGTTLHDRSGHGNDGAIHGARFVPRGSGFCLEFDGVDDFVDCSSSPALDLREALTLEAWVYPEARVPNEPGILGKHFESYLLSYYADGKCWWYVSGGGNNAKALLTAGSWHHVAGTAGRCSACPALHASCARHCRTAREITLAGQEV